MLLVPPPQGLEVRPAVRRGHSCGARTHTSSLCGPAVTPRAPVGRSTTAGDVLLCLDGTCRAWWARREAPASLGFQAVEAWKAVNCWEAAMTVEAT